MFTFVQNFFERYERHISSVALIGGFIVDSITLNRVDQFFDNIILLSYITIAGTCIVLLSFWKDEWLTGRFAPKVHAFLLIAMQFAFGGLFSAFLIFYSRSSSFIASAPFLFVLLFVLIGNEFFKAQYIRLTVQVSIFFFVLYSYLIFTIPVVLGFMNTWTFLLSGLISLLCIRIFILFIKLINPVKVISSGGMFLIVIGIFTVINGLYFLNIIPPIPLALKDSGVYHSIVKNADGTYTAQKEEHEFNEFFKAYERVNLLPGKPLYVFTSIFAPTEFKATVFHVWEQYDKKSKAWVETNRIELPILGGRDGGFRTYSVKENPSMGQWRVSVETGRGQVIGRILLQVNRVQTTPPLSPVTK